jgi:hypothetical protein
MVLGSRYGETLVPKELKSMSVLASPLRDFSFKLLGFYKVFEAFRTISSMYPYHDKNFNKINLRVRPRSFR